MPDAHLCDYLSSIFNDGRKTNGQAILNIDFDRVKAGMALVNKMANKKKRREQIAQRVGSGSEQMVATGGRGVSKPMKKPMQHRHGRRKAVSVDSVVATSEDEVEEVAQQTAITGVEDVRANVEEKEEAEEEEQEEQDNAKETRPLKVAVKRAVAKRATIGANDPPPPDS